MLAALLLAWPALVRANIGEDLGQLRARYGSAKDMGAQMLFQHDGYSICVYFDGDHSAMEVFLRDGSMPNKTDLTPEDIDALLAAAGEGKPWIPSHTQSGKQMWVRADGKLVARLSMGDSPEDKYLTIMLNAK